MSHGDDLEPAVDWTENHSIIAHAQPVVAEPFGPERLDVTRPRHSQPGDRFQDPKCLRPVNGAKLRLRFQGEWKAQPYSLPSSFSTIS